MRLSSLHNSVHSPSIALRPGRRCTWCLAGTGFGKTQGKKNLIKTEESGLNTAPRTKRRGNLAEELAELRNVTPVDNKSVDPDKDLSMGNWFQLANIDELAGDKRRKLCELKGNKKLVVLHKFQDTVYAMDAYSTAYQYPLLDGELAEGPEGPTITTPLDGTVYDLRTGKVLRWCPSDGSLLRGLLRTLKAAVQPVPLPVYPVVVRQDGAVMVRLSV